MALHRWESRDGARWYEITKVGKGLFCLASENSRSYRRTLGGIFFAAKASISYEEESQGVEFIKTI